MLKLRVGRIQEYFCVLSAVKSIERDIQILKAIRAGLQNASNGGL